MATHRRGIKDGTMVVAGSVMLFRCNEEKRKAVEGTRRMRVFVAPGGSRFRSDILPPPGNHPGTQAPRAPSPYFQYNFKWMDRARPSGPTGFVGRLKNKDLISVCLTDKKPPLIQMSLGRPHHIITLLYNCSRPI
ncbi:hypothetical protein BDV29DRAFT_43503 [Aspergillus leporis]|uniref:Uncharacterized protein n=1 Tax=Aspergillus leporis TaxID=41062 RepID=A0A5N5WRR1_9EURO|nr:hypothetical protein BDV29DRAFT_43503 [Aspergillus leporis]